MSYAGEILIIGDRHRLDPSLVMAVVQVESGGNPYAWNPEPVYRWFWDVKANAPFRKPTADELKTKVPPPDFPALAGDPDQEWGAQQASWGLMQVMGALARELGFRGEYLTELVNPLVNLDLGCKHLAALLKWSKGNVEQALAAYNGGKGGNAVAPFRNAAYAAKVLKARRI